MKFIPAIDIIDGACVRLYQGDYLQKKVYDSTPMEMAEKFFSVGVSRLHIVDLDGAKKGQPVNQVIVGKIVEKFPNSIIEIGGGIREKEHIADYVKLGVKRIILGSRAVNDMSFFYNNYETYGQKLILGLDIKDGMVATHGWQKQSNKSIFHFLNDLINKQAYPEIIFTDISTDGTLQGPALSLTSELTKQYLKLSFIASGGVSSIDDLKKLINLQAPNLIGVISGKAIYEKRFTVQDALAICN